MHIAINSKAPHSRGNLKKVSEHLSTAYHETQFLALLVISIHRALPYPSFSAAKRKQNNNKNGVRKNCYAGHEKKG